MKLHIALLATTVMLLSLGAIAQDAPKFEASVDYSYARFNPAHAYIPGTYSLNGGGGALDFNFTKYIGLVGEFEGYSSNTQRFVIAPGGLCPLGCSGNVQANLFTYMFGPQVGLRAGRIRPFAHILFGGAHTNASGNLYVQPAARPHGQPATLLP